MLEKWKTYQAEEIITGIDDSGNRLLSLFTRDYKIIMRSEICTSCNNFEEKYSNFIKKLEQMEIVKENNSGFELNPMYDHIPLGFGSQIYVSNENITDDLALELLTNHPRGKELFAVFPENVDELVSKFTTADKIEKDSETAKEKQDAFQVKTVDKIILFEKEFTFDEALELILKAGINCKETTIKGLEKTFEKSSDKEKESLQVLVIQTIEVN